MQTTRTGSAISTSHPEAIESPDLDDRDLLARLRAGDEAAFAQLVRENTGRLLVAARRILRSDEEARDAVQDAFLQAFRGLGGFQGDARLSTWLQRIAMNACLMRLRSRRRRPEIAIDELLPRFLEDGHRADPGTGWTPSALSRLESEQTRAFVREQIDRLPEDYRNVLLLRDIQDLDTDETATILGITPGAAKVRLHRARQALRSLLTAHFSAAEA
jgi:RNA polymerase sigma-70 factor, ECF subfamily